MHRLALLSILFSVSCSDEDLSLADIESEGSSYQGSSYQGSSYQGSSYQGSSYQGSSYQGSSYQGSTYGGSIYSGSVTKTALEIWKHLPDGRWEEREVDRICTWNSTKTVSTCTSINLSTTASPLAGTKFYSTFYDPNTGGTRSAYVRIGSGYTDVGAIVKDTGNYAMHPLNGASGATGPVIYPPDTRCSNPEGCRRNDDLWLYELYLMDGSTPVNFCPGGGRALALRGSYGSDGSYSSSSSSITFACLTGTIAKCTRWGYRPFYSATTSTGNTVALIDYHKACIRAAMADYCANGTTFTQDNTLVDVYDYELQQPYGGFISRTTAPTDTASMFRWESKFDKYGAVTLDFTRYEDLGNVEAACPGRFAPPTAAPPGELHQPYSRISPGQTGPIISIGNSNQCMHDEKTLGNRLNPECSACTTKLWGVVDASHQYCLTANGAWDSDCVVLASAYCSTSERLAKHSECTTGVYLNKMDTTCTFKVCSANSTCCNSSYSWSQSCVDTANQVCSGGQEGGFQAVGFCGYSNGSIGG